jgi:eukaryotic-like serine/threonine-protein kinase
MGADDLASTAQASTEIGSGQPVPAPPLLPRGKVVGRYVVVGVLGAGGMGVVYAAYDPDLGRKVALKMLRGEIDNDEQRARQLREAQALAALRDPNVIGIYDFGMQDGAFYIVMEFVDGTTLGEWLAAGPKPWRDVLERFLAAGRGLVAAHAAALIHRDFKPHNVLLGKDGRVQVSDFGLARAEPLRPSQALLATVPTRGKALDHAVTELGAVMGTPAYMAPEQHAGEPVTAQTDQFSFCVALWEGLYGQRPFAGSSAAELAAAMIHGGIQAPPTSARVPVWLRGVLERGLRLEPSERYPSMQHLIDALAADPTRRARRIGAAAGALAIVSAIVVGYGTYRARSARNELALAVECKQQDRVLAGVWDADTRRAIDHAFAASKQPFADQARQTVETKLDAYAASLVAARTSACQDTRIRGTQSEGLLDKRIACLDRKLASMKTLTELFAHADASVVDHAEAATMSLAMLETCADTASLMADHDRPWDPATQQAVQAARARLDRAYTLMRAGQYAAAAAETGEIVRVARELAYPPLLANALFVDADAKDDVNAKAAESSWLEAVAAADAAKDDSTRARALARLAENIGGLQKRWAEGQRWVVLADSALARVPAGSAIDCDVRSNLLALYVAHPSAEAVARGDRVLASCRNDERTTAEDLINLGTIELYLGHSARAIADYTQALPSIERIDGRDHPNVGMIHNGLGAICAQQFDATQARAHFERSIELLDRNKLKNDYYIEAAGSLAALLLSQADSAGAVAYARRARAAAEELYGANDPNIGDALGYEALAIAETGDYTAAIAAAKRGVSLVEPARDMDDESRAAMLTRFGQVFAAAGKLAQAEPLLVRATALHETAGAEGHAQFALDLAALGDVQLDRGRPTDALHTYERALGLMSDSEDDKPRLIIPLIGRGRAELALGRVADAITSLERAKSLADGRTLPSIQAAFLAFALARALWDGGGDRRHSHDLAEQARAALAPMPAKVRARERAEIADWLSRHQM